MMRRLFLTVMAVAVLAGFGVATASTASAARAADYTVTVQFDATVPDAYPRDSLDAWERGTRLSFVTGTCDGATPYCITVHDWTATECFGDGATGCANVGFDEFGDCNIWLHTTDPTLYYWVDPNTWRAVLVHEGGHCLGLHHSDNPKSVMYYAISSDNPVFRPIREDVRAVNALWP